MSDISCVKNNVIQPLTDVDMKEDEIYQLLQEAENRLRTPGSTTVDELKPKSKENDSRDATFLIPKLSSSHSLQPYVHEQDDFATAHTQWSVDPRQKDVPSFDPLEARTLNAPSKKVARQRLTYFDLQDKPTAGDDWFNLPKTEMTPEFKKDLQLLRMRSVLDPKRHYKKENGKVKPPAFSQMGTIIEGPTEFFSARLAKKDRKETFVEEAMGLERETRRFESKYNDIQVTKRSGKKSYYKDLRSRRGHISK